jgi:hypothetical protein
MVLLLRAEGCEEPQVGLVASEDGRPPEAEAMILPLAPDEALDRGSMIKQAHSILMKVSTRTGRQAMLRALYGRACLRYLASAFGYRCFVGRPACRGPVACSTGAPGTGRLGVRTVDLSYRIVVFFFSHFPNFSTFSNPARESPHIGWSVSPGAGARATRQQRGDETRGTGFPGGGVCRTASGARSPAR